jgi:ParB-like chromosome segregation protein Spo0J
MGLKELTEQLVRTLALLSEDERIDAINSVRAAVHEVSPLKHHPVDFVEWVWADSVQGNDYNPNSVAPPEMRLLAHSVEANGFTMPIVGHDQGEKIVIVDGFHRQRVGRETPDIRASVRDRLPVTRIRAERSDEAARIAATVEHNRARGEHKVEAMSDVVRMLYRAGWRDEKIQEELGMGPDEVLRLKQITGLAELFASREFSEAWEPVDESRVTPGG